jgi:DNA topoisomerase I
MFDGNHSSEPVAVSAAMARAAGLTYVCDSMPGIVRRRRGTGFIYFDGDGHRITDAEELLRIRALAIPPAYEDVWICPDPRGHLQATGRDARRRKQYRYHPEWRTVRDGAKFGRMIEFGEALPRLRRRIRRDLALAGLPRDKVLAVVLRLLDTTRVRIGNEDYARQNSSFGLTTLRNRHARFIRDGRLILQFRGKGGAEHVVTVDDKRLVRLVRHCQQLPGQQLFQYLDDDGVLRAVTSDLVNDYLREAMGADFTAKDFRTWGATLHAIELMARVPLPDPLSERACKRCIVAAIAVVAHELRNTPAVCRKSYINPVVFDAWRCGTLQARVPASSLAGARKREFSALAFLRQEARAAKRVPTTSGRLQPRASGRPLPSGARSVRKQSAELAPQAVGSP